MLGALSVLSGVDIPYHMEKDKSLSCLISIPFFLWELLYCETCYKFWKSEHIFTVNNIFSNLSQELLPVAKSSGFAPFGRMPRGCQVCLALQNQLLRHFLDFGNTCCFEIPCTSQIWLYKQRRLNCCLKISFFHWSFALEKRLFCILLVNFDISVDQVCRKHANRRDNSNLLKPNLKGFLCLHFAWLIFPKSKHNSLPRRICLLTICKLKSFAHKFWP